MTIDILLLEDSDLDAELIAGHLRRGGVPHRLTRVSTRDEYVDALSGGHHLILADFSLPSFDGLSALAIAHERTPETPFIFVSGTLGAGGASASTSQKTPSVRAASTNSAKSTGLRM